MILKEILTIGHSTHPLDEFLGILAAHQIELVADIRRFPGSRRLPQYNRETLEESLRLRDLGYVHLPGLGGRRSPDPGSRNTGWRVPAFRGYADYMDTQPFKLEVSRLEELALTQRTAYMCSEAVWWSCHRALVSDYLKHRGWTVRHIMSKAKADEHPWTKPARIIDGRLLYTLPGTLDL